MANSKRHELSIGPLTVIYDHASAWRGIYLRLGAHQVAHIALDPKNGGPTLSVSASPTLRTHFSRRFAIPHLRWRNNASARYLKAYKFQQALLHRLDGRFNEDW